MPTHAEAGISCRNDDVGATREGCAARKAETGDDADSRDLAGEPSEGVKARDIQARDDQVA